MFLSVVLAAASVTDASGRPVDLSGENPEADESSELSDEEAVATADDVEGEGVVTPEAAEPTEPKS